MKRNRKNDKQIYRDDTLPRFPLNINQHAYLAGKSTDTALHTLVGKIERAINSQQYALGVILDIEGAFNNASTNSPLNVLRSKKVSITIIQWIARVNSGDVIEVYLLKGFPQGGVLSALMWILVADSLLTILNSAGYFTQGFADFSILVEGIDLSTVCEVLQAALHKNERWRKDHGLSANPEKTEMVLFT